MLERILKYETDSVKAIHKIAFFMLSIVKLCYIYYYYTQGGIFNESMRI